MSTATAVPPRTTVMNQSGQEYTKTEIFAFLTFLALPPRNTPPLAGLRDVYDLDAHTARRMLREWERQQH